MNTTPSHADPTQSAPESSDSRGGSATGTMNRPPQQGSPTDLGGTHVTWPESSFFWAVLTPPFKLASALTNAPGLAEEFQALVPIPLQELQTLYVPLATGKALVCSARVDELNGVSPRVLAVSPASVPGELIEAAGVDPSSINLLTGRFLPPPLRRERRRRMQLVALASVVLSLACSVGFWRRTTSWRQESELLAAAQTRLVAQITGDDPAKSNGPIAAIRMQEELRSLRQTRHAGRSDAGASPTDAAVTLASFLQGWPRELDADTESLIVAPDTVSTAVTIPGSVQDFLTQFKTPSGWSRSGPQITSSGTDSRLSLSWQRWKEGGR